MGRARLVAVWFLQVALALLFLVQSWMKLSGSGAWIDRFRAWGYPEHFYLVVGVAELVGAVALLVPRLTSFGAAFLMLVMAGAAITHALHGERQIVTTLVLFGLLSLVVYLRRGEWLHIGRPELRHS